MYRKLTFLISLVALLALANGAFAAVFTGAVDNRFCEPGNWDTLAVPGPGEEVEIAGFDVVIDCDVTAGTLRGPGWDTGDPASLTVEAGNTVYFEGADRHESDSTWAFHVAGSLTIDGGWRFADEGNVTWNISGAGASIVVNDNVRAGDNGGTSWDVNIDSGVLVIDGECSIGDDGSGIWNVSGTGSVSILDDFFMRARTCDSVQELNVSGNGEVVVDGRLQMQDGDRSCGYGEVTLNMDGGTVNITGDIRAGDNGPGIINMNTGLLVVGGTLDVRGDDPNTAAELNGGEIRAGDLDVSNGGVVNVQEPNAPLLIPGGLLILSGNKLSTVGSLAGAGKLVALPCASPRGIVGALVSGNTSVTADCGFDVCQAYAPSPPSGAEEIRSVITEVIIEWSEGDCLGIRGRNYVYFGTDPVAVDNAVIGDPENIAVNRGGSNTLNLGNLPLWTTHYWRIDEFNADNSTTKGELWNFTTGCEAIPGDINMDCLVNFDDYAELAATFGEEEFWPE